MSELKVKYQDYADKIIATKGCDSFDHDGHCGQEVADILMKNGFKKFKSKTYCTKASFEVNLKKGNVVVNIINSNFIGKFTMFEVSVE